MGYATNDEQSALEAFLADYRGKTELNRKILDHLLHDAFSDDRQTQAEVDLVLDPDPPRGADRRGVGQVPLPRREAGVSQSDVAGRGADSLPFDAALPAFSGGDRAAVAGGHRRHGRPRFHAGEPRPGERLAGRQGRALGAVQLQSAQPAAVRRAVRLQPVPVGHSHQQSRA